MKIGKLNSRLNRFGGKLKSDVGNIVGKTQKVIRQGERGVVKGINAVASVADSKEVRGLQQGTLIAGRALGATGIPELQGLGVALTGVGMGVKGAREVLPDKIEKAKKKIALQSNKMQSQVEDKGSLLQRNISRGVKGGSQVAVGNMLEKAPPATGFEELPNYVD